MDYRYASNYTEIKRIDRLNKMTNPETLFSEVNKITKNMVSITAINSWHQLARIRYLELTKDNGSGIEFDFEPIRNQPTKESIILEVEKLIKEARTEQKILDNMLYKLFKKIDELDIDLDVPTNAENAGNLDEAINCYIHYGEFSLKGLIDEIKNQCISKLD